MPNSKPAAADPSGPVTVSATTQDMMKHLNMKLPSSRPKKTTEPPVPQEPPSRNTPQILRNLSLADLVVIAKQQDHEISELDSKISSYTERRYVGTI